MSTRSGAGESTRNMILQAPKVAKKKVVPVRRDNAKELMQGEAKKFIDENGTMIEKMPPFSPECNGRAERANRTILEKARTIMAELNMICKVTDYKELWPQALL